MTRIYDSTMLKDWRRCAEFYRSRHVLGLVQAQRERGALDAGQAIHHALRAWFADHGLEEAKHALARSWGDDPLFTTKPAKYTLGFLQAVLEGYAERWPRERDPFRVLQNEDWIESPTTNYGGIVDRVVELDDGHWVMDTKTTSMRFSEHTVAGYQLSHQLRGYVALLRERGRECQGVYLDLVHLDTRGHKVKPEHFLREKVLFSKEQLRAFWDDTRVEIAAIERLQERLRGRWPQNSDACFKWNRRCPYWERCVSPEAVADQVGDYTVEPWRPQERVS